MEDFAPLVPILAAQIASRRNNTLSSKTYQLEHSIQKQFYLRNCLTEAVQGTFHSSGGWTPCEVYIR